MATQYYASVNDFRTMKDVAHAGTSGTAADLMEVRIGDGTYLPSREEALLGLLILQRWIMQGGLNQAGANLPIPASGTHS